MSVFQHIGVAKLSDLPQFDATGGAPFLQNKKQDERYGNQQDQGWSQFEARS